MAKKITKCQFCGGNIKWIKGYWNLFGIETYFPGPHKCKPKFYVEVNLKEGTVDIVENKEVKNG